MSKFEKLHVTNDNIDEVFLKLISKMRDNIHFKYLNARFECNDIVIFIYSHYPLDPNAKSSDTKGKTFSIR